MAENSVTPGGVTRDAVNREAITLLKTDPEAYFDRLRARNEALKTLNANLQEAHADELSRADAAEVMIGAVRALHPMWDAMCPTCQQPWPCETIQALGEPR